MARPASVAALESCFISELQTASTSSMDAEIDCELQSNSS
jgi:hypothetical protein